MKNILNFKLKPIQLLNTFALVALLMVIYSIASIALTLINEYNIINRGNIYPARFHLFNSNVYIGIALIIQVIYSVIVAPVLEEFIFRYWLDKETSKNKILLFTSFIFNCIFLILFFFLPGLSNHYNSFFLSIIPNSEYQNLFLTIITLFVFPIILSIISIKILKLINYYEQFEAFVYFLIKKYFYFLIILSAIMFALIHLDINFTDFKFVNNTLIIISILRIVTSIFKVYFKKYISFKFIVLLHAFNNSIILFSYTIFWQRPIAIYYSIGLGIYVLLTLFGLFLEYKKSQKSQLFK